MGHFGDEPFQLINCITKLYNNQEKNTKKNTKITPKLEPTDYKSVCIYRAQLRHSTHYIAEQLS